jgi:hypothetical protein
MTAACDVYDGCRRWDKLPEVQEEVVRQQRMLARKRYFGYYWTDTDEEGLQARLRAALMATKNGSEPLHVPGMVRTVAEAVEIAMETGQPVVVDGAGQYTWEPTVLSVLYNSSLLIQSVRSCSMHGAWELMEGCKGMFAGGNYSLSAQDECDTTFLVRGAEWMLEDCDVRCIGGTVVRACNGGSSFAQAYSDDQLFPSMNFDEADMSSRVTLRRCGIGGQDPDRFERVTHSLTGSLEQGERAPLARNAVDVFDSSTVECYYCSLADTENVIARTGDTSSFKMER